MLSTYVWLRLWDRLGVAGIHGFHRRLVRDGQKPVEEGAGLRVVKREDNDAPTTYAIPTANAPSPKPPLQPVNAAQAYAAGSSHGP
jgi:hypothetical protein